MRGRFFSFTIYDLRDARYEIIVAAMQIPMAINQTDIDSSNVFCITIPAIKPTATNSKGVVLMICLWTFAGPQESCLSIRANFRCISSMAKQTTDSSPRTQD